MKFNFSSFVSRFLSAFMLAILVLSLVGIPTKVVYALTTPVTDDPANITIPDPAINASCTSSVTRTINVAASVVIADINVILNISHSRRSDVRATLTSPAGTNVVLIAGAGLGSPTIASPDSYNNYDVTLDDTSAGSLYDNGDDVVGGGVGITDRTARPFELLNAFKGENAAGNWTLNVCDTRNGSDSGAAGTYNYSQLIITSADPNTVSGTVFTDYNDNGMRGSGDTGVAGVTVTAYDSTGAVVGAPVLSDALGNYSLTVPNGTQIRLEFSTIPANLRPGAFGRDSGTTVQFVTSPAAGVDLGLSKPDEYCQNNPFLVMPCYINGDTQAGGTAANASVLYSIPNTAYGRADDNITQTLAQGSEIGATWGMAYQRSTSTVFAGALAKRHASFGPGGGGAIYSLVVNPIDGTGSTPTLFVDIDTFAGIDDGPLDDTVRNLPMNSPDPNTDPAAWDAVGKQSIADIDIGADDNTLWLINLTDQTLYSLLISAPTGFATATPITLANTPGCPSGPALDPNLNVRPWAVEVYQGNVYVGVVCSAESSGLVSDLRAYILSTPEGTPGTWTLVYEFALDYPRGYVSADAPTYPAEWRPWSNVFTSLYCTVGCNSATGLSYGNQLIYPQPILSDIEFDTDGDMILGLMDRMGHQTGEVNYSTSAVTTSFDFYDFTNGYALTSVTIAAGSTFEGTSAGDILRVCNVAGVFTVENNANCGGILTGGASGAPAQGPNGGEYYWQDMHPISAVRDSGTHHEVSLGGLVLFPGTDEVATSIFDPFDIRSGGLAWFSNTTGTRTRGYEIFARTDTADRFGKAAGIGDIEGFCFQAPIEIGNRIWLDDDGDGVQDAGENPIAGVTVELYQGATLIGTAVTDANGGYYFSSRPGVAGTTASQIYNLSGLNPNESYEIRIPNAQGGTPQLPLAGLLLTTNDVLPPQDQRDSDATYVGNDAVITMTTGPAGNNDHTFDFGFTATYSLGNRVWFDTNNSATIDGTEVGINGVRVELFRDTGASPGVWDAGDTFLLADITDPSGYYRFDNLLADDYVVLIPNDNFTVGGTTDALVRYWSSSTSIAAAGTITDATDSIVNDPDTDVDDSDDNGLTTLLTVSSINYVASAAVTLGPGTSEPTTDNDSATGLNPETGEAANNRSDRTVDFGFYRVDIGDIVFEDVDGNGFYDSLIDLPMTGAIVTLHSSDGTQIPVGADGILGTADDGPTGFTTPATGIYNFSGLPAGNYIVRVTPPVGFISTLDTAGSLNPESNVNNDDNGIGVAGGTVSSGILIMTPGEVLPNITLNNAAGSTSDPTVDFGFVRAYSLGNRVWFDTNNDRLRDPAELGVDGVLVELYAADGSGNPTGPALQNTITAGGGYYRFDNLLAGDYVVVIPADNFDTLGLNNELVGYWSSGTSRLPTGTLTELPAPDPDAPTSSDFDDNGTLVGADVRSLAVTLGPGSNEPTVEPDVLIGIGQGADDNRADMTVDFGFYTMTLGNQVWADLDDDGLLSGGELGINGVTLQLLSGDGLTLITTTTTAVNGNYSFTGLPAGDYIVRIDPAEFNVGGTLEGTTSSTGGAGTPYEPAPDSDVNTTDSDDNGSTVGVLGAGGFVETAVITLTPGAEANSVNATGITNEPRVDLGIVTPQIYSLGNRVWFDTNNDGTQDLINESGVNGVVIELYAADGSGNPTGIPLTSTTTAGGGYYRFDNLPAGDYVVVLPASNFSGAGALVGYWSSGTTMDGAGVISEGITPLANSNIDLDDNGTLQTVAPLPGAVISSVVSLGPLGSEPTNDDDPDPLSQAGEAPDDFSNRTVDFGFYRVDIGDLVFVDTNENGTYDGLPDAVLPGATVQLFASNGTEINVGVDGILGTADDLLGDFVTGPSGTYNFTGLPEGEYIVRVTPPTAGYTSTVDTAFPGDTTDPDGNVDNNDNGIGLGAGQVSSGPLLMTPGEFGFSANGMTSDPTVDFGFLPTYSLGNRVWFDTDNDAAIDFGVGGEQGIPNVRVELYLDDGASPGVWDAGDTSLGFDTTDPSGYYRFDGLAADNYIVVLSNDNFTVGGTTDALVGYWSSQTTMAANGALADATVVDPDSNIDSDDNGLTTFTIVNTIDYVAASAVTLGPLSIEPTLEADAPLGQGAADARANMTVDFGFYRQQLGDLIFEDVDNDGLFTTGTDTPLAGAVVTLFAADGTTQILVGPDGILGTADDNATGVTTGAGGTYLFSGLPQGDYIVRVTPPAGYFSTIDSADQTDNDNPNTNTNNNDNGDGVAAGPVSSAPVTLTPGFVGAATNNTVTQNNGTTFNPTVDFGFVQTASGGLTKILLSSNQPFTADPEVAIGEIVTYRVVVNIPTGVFTNAQLVDTLERGLSFMDCTAITSGAGTLTATDPLGNPLLFPDICANPFVENVDNTGAPSADPVDVGRRVTFNFFTLTNPGAPQTLTIDYRAVVLDSAANVSGVDLDNSAVWSSSAGTIGPRIVTVRIVEPDVSIAKTSSTAVASVGSVITLTLTIDHTAASQTDAYDLLVSDPLPVELDLVLGTLVCNAGVQPATTCAYIAGTRTIEATWTNFALGAGDGQITFDATVLSLPATNVANVAWTSLPGVPPSPPGNPLGQQNANIFSTERDYDPLSPINVYGTSSTLVLNALANIANIPDTGFAPNVKTDLSNVPFQTYNTLAESIWFEIPSLGVKSTIVGVPRRNGAWNVAWLGRQAGWLEGSAFPTWQGNSVITSHVYLSNGLPGPFIDLGKLKYGDKIIVHIGGEKFTYEIRTNKVVNPQDTSVFKHEDEAWLTLITCKEFDEKTNTYLKRVVVRAVLIKVEAEK